MSSNKVIGYAIIGCGCVSERHMVGITSIGKAAALRVICDIDRDKARTLAKKFPGVDIESDYSKVLARNDVDAVVICLPTFLHEDSAIKAAEHGKHLFIEKPLALNVESALRIINACKNNKVQLYVGHSCRYLPEMKRAKEIITEGRLGKIFKARAVYCSSVNYSQDPRRWKREPEKDLGALLNTGIHNADNLRFLLGKEAVSVFSHTNIVRPEKVKLFDNGLALIKFEGDISAIWEVSESQVPLALENKLPQEVLVEIFGTQGTIKVNLAGKLEVRLLDEQGNELIIEESSNVFYEIWNDMHQDFFENITKNTMPCISGEEGLKSLALVSAVFESGGSNQPVKVNL